MTQPPRAIERIRTDVRSMHSYVVQNAQGLVKLDAMENPYALPAALQQALGCRLGQVAINRYPAQRIADLHAALAIYVNLPSQWALMLGNGSDELISLLALACAQHTDSHRACIVAPEPGFVMYEVGAKLQGLDYVGVPLTADFELDVPATCQAIHQHRPALVYLAYPNNPTANMWRKADIEAIIAAQKAQGGLVVMDEAYQPFAAHTWLDCIRNQPEQHSHVLLMRTLSKFGLAGVRLGYLLGAQSLISEFDKVRPPYNISVLNAECALFALEHADIFAAQAQHICSERERLLAALSALPSVTAYPSQANMILIRVPDAMKTFDGLKKSGILVKNVSKMHTLLHNCLRLTVGTPDENNQLLTALAANLSMP